MAGCLPAQMKQQTWGTEQWVPQGGGFWPQGCMGPADTGLISLLSSLLSFFPLHPAPCLGLKEVQVCGRTPFPIPSGALGNSQASLKCHPVRDILAHPFSDVFHTYLLLIFYPFCYQSPFDIWGLGVSWTLTILPLTTSRLTLGWGGGH